MNVRISYFLPRSVRFSGIRWRWVISLARKRELLQRNRLSFVVGQQRCRLASERESGRGGWW